MITPAAPWPRRVAVLGVGTMGHGIAQQFAVHGRDVCCWDSNGAALAAVPAAIARNVEIACDMGAIAGAAAAAALANVRLAGSLRDAVTDADLVVEAIAEQLEPKQRLFAAAEEAAPRDSVLASNTSAIDIDAIASACSDRTRVLGTHWFNPPHIVPAVEVVPGRETGSAVVARVVEALRSVARIPCITRNAPGFVANRIQFAMVAEAFRCLEDGVADAETIDEIVRSSFGPRLAAFGLFEIADLAGLDVYTAILDLLARDLEQPGFEPTAALRELASGGRLGVKTGGGVFEYASTGGAREDRDRALYRVFATRTPTEVAT